MDDSATFKYDVAISFVQSDEATAEALADALRETSAVFLYSERQRELAGRDGVDEFTEIFRDQARVCVILYRDGWGKTKWTRVEETAIKDRAFDKGWDFLTVIALTPGAPIWLPKTKLWLGFERFGLLGAVAVIEARIREQGGETVPETARARAERLARAASARAELGLFLNSDAGASAARAELRMLREYLAGEVAAMRAQQPPVNIAFDETSQGSVLGVSAPGAAFTFGWSVQFSNSLRGSSMLIQEFERPYRVGQNQQRPPLVNRETWLFTRTLSGNPAWYEKSAPEQLLSSHMLAERFLKRLLDRSHTNPNADSLDW